MERIQLETPDHRAALGGPTSVASLPVNRELKVGLAHPPTPLPVTDSVHPVDRIQRDVLRFIHRTSLIKAVKARLTQANLRHNALANIYGTHFPMRLQFEQQLLSQFHRPGGPLTSSYVALETYMGLDEELQLEEVLGDPEFSTDRPLGIHEAMEAQIFGKPL